MKRKEQDLQRYYQECRGVMIGLGYDAYNIPISLNGRLKRTLGQYFTKAKKIEVSKHFFLHGTDYDVKNVIIHEICHQMCKTDMGHGEEWKRIAKHVSDNSIYRVSRVTNVDKGSIQPTKKREKKYIVVCKDCNREWKYASVSNAYKNPQNCICPFCKTSNLYSYKK